jgi:hypothetical protein
VLTPLVVADLMRGTGHYNLALGFVATAQGIGASLSGLEAGLIVDHFSYNAAKHDQSGEDLFAVLSKPMLMKM